MIYLSKGENDEFTEAYIFYFYNCFFSQAAAAAEWYEGGTLHQANALEWQQATAANKLATVGDFVAGTYKREGFKPEIQKAIRDEGMPGIKVLSEAIVEQMDIAFAPEPDAEENRKLFTNQKIADITVMIMSLSGFIGN